MAIRYRLGTILWIVTLLAVALGWFCDRRRLEARHALEVDQLVEARHGREIRQLEARYRTEMQEHLIARRRAAVLLENGLERQYQLTELLRKANGPATELDANPTPQF
jgi:hypothetical protein